MGTSQAHLIALGYLNSLLVSKLSLKFVCVFGGGLHMYVSVHMKVCTLARRGEKSTSKTIQLIL